MKQLFKESFLNIQFIIIFILTILFAIIFILTKLDILLYISLLGILLIILYIIGFIRNINMNKSINRIKQGILKYEPLEIDRETFIKECNEGLLYSIIRIDGIIYEIDTQVDDINKPNPNKFICNINDKEIIGVENFLNYKFDGSHTFKDLEKIEFLECNKTDPKKWLINRTI